MWQDNVRAAAHVPKLTKELAMTPNMEVKLDHNPVKMLWKDMRRGIHIEFGY